MNPLVISYGAGVNSLALVHGYYERGVRPDAIVFSDTRGEKIETYAHMRDHVQPYLERIGFPALITVCRADFGRGKTGDQSLEDECLRLGTLPSRAYGYGTCADKWKIDPFKWWAQTWGAAQKAWAEGGSVIRAIGYDTGERYRVSEVVDAKFTKVYPLLEWGWERDACLHAIRRAGLPIPPKSACFYCPSSKKREVLWLNEAHPSLMRRALALESRALAGGRWDVKGLGRNWSWAEVIAADEAQLKLFQEAPVESCMMCADGEPDEDEAA